MGPANCFYHSTHAEQVYPIPPHPTLEGERGMTPCPLSRYHCYYHQDYPNKAIIQTRSTCIHIQGYILGFSQVGEDTQ